MSFVFLREIGHPYLFAFPTIHVDRGWVIKPDDANSYVLVVLLMEEILHQLNGKYPSVYKVLYMPGGQVVQDFFHQQFVGFLLTGQTRRDDFMVCLDAGHGVFFDDFCHNWTLALSPLITLRVEC